MDIKRALMYPKSDPQWISKIGIYVLLMIGCVLIVPVFPIIGYQIEIIRRVARGEDEVLPPWDEWNVKFMDGLKFFGIMLVYEIPIFLIIGISMGISFAMIAAGGNSDSTGAMSGIVMLITQGISGIYGLFIAFIMPIVMIMLARTGNFGDAFKFGELLGHIKGNLSNYIITCLLFMGFLLGAEILGFIACCVGILVTIPYAYMAVSHLMGQLSRQIFGAGAGVDEYIPENQ